MRKRLKLRPVDEDNWTDVAEMELPSEQEDYVASNLWSIAESKFDPTMRPLAIYDGKKLVGFLMYQSLEEDDEPHEYSIFRLMIAPRHQRKGYGAAALRLTLARIEQEDRDWERITICYDPKNKPAAKLYASVGFREVGVDEDGEMIAEISS